MATLSSIAGRVVRGTGILAPSTIFGSSDETAQRLLEALQQAGEVMSRRHRWVVLTREAAVTTADGTAEYALESDFDRLVTETAWQAENFWKMRGNLTPGRWQFEQNAIVAWPSIQKGFRIKVDGTTKKLFLVPTPTVAEDLVYEYVSNGWCTSSGGTRQSAWAADSDVLLLEESAFVMLARALFKESSGLPYLSDLDMYERQVRTLIAQELALPPVRLATAIDPGRVTAPIPEGNFGL